MPSSGSLALHGVNPNSKKSLEVFHNGDHGSSLPSGGMPAY